ncbi:MAG: MoaD/ThiS family protein [Rhodospirillaceae bacterium]|jgi:sulfur-carrier protein|nr:MoaD/ThiS family protein [Rhodospirillaceae bacterium]MBT6139453.1 MoaD/ThiS family protein [Rhodospirillaceae bacterium]
MPTRVVFSSSLSDRYTGGENDLEIDATSMRGVIRALEERFPGIGEHLEEETSVAIDGEIHETAYFQPLKDGSEIFFIPKLEGG